MAINSLYECAVMHCRLRPKRHGFTYRVFMFCVDLEDLPALRSFGFSHNRWNLFSINDEDHIDVGKPGGIQANLIAWLADQGQVFSSDVRIRLLTFPRVFGYGFNPVSFYYIDSKAGEPLAAVAEVVNTFREMKLYPMSALDAEGAWHRRVRKDFYVSPFSDPAMEFDFKLGQPGEDWQVNIDDYDAEGRVLLSSVSGKRRELSAMRLIWFGIKYPLLSMKIMGLIHWQAMLLWVRKVPFLRKSERLDAQLDVMRPHSSLKQKLP